MANNTDTDPGDTLMEHRHPQLLADAFVALIRKATTGAGSGSSSAPSPRNGAVLALYNLGDVAERLIDGAPLPIETIRRMACEAGIMTGGVDDHGAVLYLGRQVRLASPAQRLALQTMYSGCTNCGSNWAWCDMHHIVPWDLGGPTDLDNLAPLCKRCHHLFHEGRWRMVSPALGVIEIFTPTGYVHKTVRPHAPPRAA